MELKLQFAKTDKAYGQLRRGVAVIVDGKEVSTDEINLVSASVKNTIAKRIAKLARRSLKRFSSRVMSMP